MREILFRGKTEDGKWVEYSIQQRRGKVAVLR